MTKIKLDPSESSATVVLQAPDTNSNTVIELPSSNGSIQAGVDFSATTISGNTPSLDVGSHYVFDHGTLTDSSITLSFTNVPTKAKWVYIAEQSLMGYYSAVSLSYTGVTANVMADAFNTTFNDAEFSPDGSRLFVMNRSNFFSYSLSTAYDISTRSASIESGQNFDFYNDGFYNNNPNGFAWNNDGTKLYALFDSSGDQLYEYNLSTAYDISTMVKGSNFGIGQYHSFPSSVDFVADGSSFVSFGRGNGRFHQYPMSAAWDITTATYDYQKIYDAGFYDSVNDVYDFSFVENGFAIYGVCQLDTNGTIAILKWELGTAYDITTMSLVETYDFANSSTPLSDPAVQAPRAVFFNSDGSKAIFGGTDETLYEFNSTSGALLTLPNEVTNPSKFNPGIPGQTLYTEFYTLDGGASVNILKSEAR